MSEAIQHERALNQASRESFDTFAMRAFSAVNGESVRYEWNWHIGCIAEHLEAVRTGQIKKLIINVPPRTLKSYLVDAAFPAWVMGLEPHAKFIMASYSHDVAKDHVVNCKNILNEKWYQDCFPETRLDPFQNEKHYFKTTGRGSYYGTGILGTITGKGADYVICDDPIRPDEALSDTIRSKTNAAIRNTLFSRFNDPRIGRFIMVMQRLHDDDPSGHLLRDEGYTLLKLPAEAHRPVIVTLNDKAWAMAPGELLFPSRLTEEVLAEKRKDMLDYNYVGQYLQEPVPLGGGEFNDTQINYYDNSSLKLKEMNIYILCDAAGGEELQKKKKKKSDYTSFVVIGLNSDNNYYLLDLVRDRLNPTERVDKLFELHRTWNGLSGKPPKVGYEKYGLMSDTHYIRVKQKEYSYRFPLIELGGTMQKEERIRRMLPDLKQGRWWFPPVKLYTDYDGRTIDLVREIIKSEMATFPRARYDDMLDALTRIYDDAMQAVFPRLKKKSDLTTKSNRETHWTDF